MAKIYAYSSNNISCEYTLNTSRSGSTISITASGTIYGNGASADADSGQKLFAQLRYGVSPANTSGTTTYVSSYGTLLSSGWTVTTTINGYSGTKSTTKIADNDDSGYPSLNATGFPTSGRSFTITWSKTDNNALNLSNVALFFFRDATETTVSTTDRRKTYVFSGKKDSSLSTNNLRYYTQNIVIDVGVTAPGAPTQINCNLSVQKRNSNIIITWNNGTNGQGNNISAYALYRYVNNTSGSGILVTTTTNTQYTYTIPDNATRGAIYYFKVKSIGTVSGLDSPISTVTAQCKINSLPTTPSVTVSGTTVVNNEHYIRGTNTFKFSLSATDVDGQTISYFYDTSAQGTNKRPVNNNTTFTINTNTTYYFWAYDTMEYSSTYSIKTINYVGGVFSASINTKNTKQATSNVSGSSVTYIYGAKSVINPTNAIGNVTYAWKIKHRTNGSTGSFSTSSLGYTTKELTWTYPGASLGWNKEYKLLCEVKDDSGSTVAVEMPNTYKIPAQPIFETNIYNDINNGQGSSMGGLQKSGSYPNDFYQDVVARATIDTAVSSITFSTSPNTTIVWNPGKNTSGDSASIETYRQSGFIPLKITGTNAITQYTLTTKITTVWNGSVTKSYTITRTGLPRINSTTRYSVSNITNASPSTIKPFTSSASFNINFTQPNAISNNNFSTPSGNNVKVFLYANNKEIEVQNQGNWELNNNIITIPTIQGGNQANSGLYNWSTNTLNLNLNSSNTVGLRIKMQDVFGTWYSVSKSNYLTLNYVETPSITNFTINKSSGDVIYEGSIITYTPTIVAYNTDKDIDIKTYIYRSTNSGQPTGGEWILYSGNQNNGEVWRPIRSGSNSQISKQASYQYTVGEISESYYLFFKTVITPFGQNSIDSNIVGYNIGQRQISISNLKFTTTVFSNNIFSCSFDLTDYGAGRINDSGTYTGISNAYYGIQFSTDSSFNTVKYLSVNNDIGSLSNTEVALGTINSGTSSIAVSNVDLSQLSDWRYYNIRIVYWTIVNNNTKYSYGQPLVLYNIAPLVSYRQGQLGINVKNLDNSNYSNSFLVLNASTGKEYIKLNGLNNSYGFDLTSGQIDGNLTFNDVITFNDATNFPRNFPIQSSGTTLLSKGVPSDIDLCYEIGTYWCNSDRTSNMPILPLSTGTNYCILNVDRASGFNGIAEGVVHQTIHYVSTNANNHASNGRTLTRVGILQSSGFKWYQWTELSTGRQLVNLLTSSSINEYTVGRTISLTKPINQFRFIVLRIGPGDNANGSITPTLPVALLNGAWTSVYGFPYMVNGALASISFVFENASTIKITGHTGGNYGIRSVYGMDTLVDWTS